MLKVQNLSNKILKNIDFQIDQWEIMWLVGANGSGKSTLGKSIIGLQKNQKGKIIYQDKDITDSSPSQRAQKGLCYIFQHIPTYWHIKVQDYFDAFIDDIETDYFDMFGISWDDYKNRYFSDELSGGERKKLEILLNFMLDKDFYIIDEIETSLDQFSKQALKKLIKQMNQDWKTFLIISHNEQIQDLSDESILLCDGEIKMIDDTQKVLKYDKDNCETCEK